MSTWTYELAEGETEKSTEFYKQFIAFLQSCLTQRLSGKGPTRPEFIPAEIRVLRTIVSEIPLSNMHALPGVYECSSNQWGAIAVACDNGRNLGMVLIYLTQQNSVL